MMTVQHKGHDRATVHQSQPLHRRWSPQMSQAALWSAVISFPPPKHIGFTHLKDNCEHACGCSDTLSTNEVYRKGTTDSRSRALPSSQPARSRRGLWGSHTLSRVNTVWLKQTKMRYTVAAEGDYRGLHFGRSRLYWDNQPKRCTSRQGEAAVVETEDPPQILEWLLPARQVMMGGGWTFGAWLVSGRTVCPACPWSPFPLIPNSKSEVEGRGWCTDAGAGYVPTDNGGHIPMGYKHYVSISSKILQSLTPYRPIDHVINQEPGSNLQYGQICNLSEVELKPFMA